MRLRMGSLGLSIAIGLAAAQAGLAADFHGRHHHRLYASHGHVAIGDCVRTRVQSLGPVAGIPEASTPVIRYRDGVIQAFDGDMQGHIETKPGDPIRLCLVSFTRDCGADDLPGRTYETGNLRTGAAWTLPDVRSSCEAH